MQPLQFKPEMIEKIVRGEKTQTRRLVKERDIPKTNLIGQPLFQAPIESDENLRIIEVVKLINRGKIYYAKKADGQEIPDEHEVIFPDDKVRTKYKVGDTFAVTSGHGKPAVWYCPKENRIVKSKFVGNYFYYGAERKKGADDTVLYETGDDDIDHAYISEKEQRDYTRDWNDLKKFGMDKWLNKGKSFTEGCFRIRGWKPLRPTLTAIRREKLTHISADDAIAEGFAPETEGVLAGSKIPCIYAFLDYFYALYDRKPLIVDKLSPKEQKYPLARTKDGRYKIYNWQPEVWVLEFEKK